MEDDLANIRLSNDEEENAFHKDAQIIDRDLQFSLVGTCLTDSVAHFSSLRNTLVDLWHPIGGILPNEVLWLRANYWKRVMAGELGTGRV